MLPFFLACSTPPPSPPPSLAPSSPVPAAAVPTHEVREGGQQATASAPDYAARVAELKAMRAALAAAVHAGDLGAVHPLAEGAVDIAVDLPARATGLSASDQATVALRVDEIRVDGLALRDRADAGDAAGAKAALAKVTAEIDALAAVGVTLAR